MSTTLEAPEPVLTAPQSRLTSLRDHIDEPIKKVVVGLNLLGIKTAMSCCGFTYKGEAVAKKHLEKAYVYVDRKGLSSVELCLLIDLAARSGWQIGFMSNGRCMDVFVPRWDDRHPWSVKDCPHYYEQFVLGIRAMEQALNGYQERFAAEATIGDGNAMYKDEWGIKHWQYEPTEAWVVTPETYKAL